MDLPCENVILDKDRESVLSYVNAYPTDMLDPEKAVELLHQNKVMAKVAATGCSLK
jgi:hypothetical protein